MTPEYYLARLKTNEPITDINLSNQNLTDIRLWPLLNFLNNPLNSAAAQRVIGLSFNGNRFTTINVQGLTALELIILDNNPLTNATKIALKALNDVRIHEGHLQQGVVNFTYDYEMEMPKKLTTEILDAHFQPMLQVNPDEMIGYIKKIRALDLQSLLQAEQLITFAEMLSVPEIERACASMTNFQCIFGRLAELNNDNTQLDILNAYNDTRFKVLVNAAKNYYDGVFYSIDEVIRARRTTERANTLAVNQPIAKAPVLFSSIPPATGETRNDTDCGFKPGFLLNRKNGLFN